MKLSELGFDKEDEDYIRMVCIMFNCQQLIEARGDFKIEWWKNKLNSY